MQADMDGSMVMSAAPSSSPAQRERSFTATAADRMRTKRSSSRISQRTPSKHSDEDSSKTAVKVGKSRNLDGLERSRIKILTMRDHSRSSAAAS